IDPSWAAIDPIPVISTPSYGDLIAPALLTELKIQSQKDTKQLAEAKEIAYKEGFYNGTMLVGEFKGQSVQDAKAKVRERMLEAGLAFAYAEPRASSSRGVRMSASSPSWTSGTWTTERKSGEAKLRSECPGIFFFVSRSN
ncbi:hypothetical protein DXG03_006826, partial [Asterophora parasitica]